MKKVAVDSQSMHGRTFLVPLSIVAATASTLLEDTINLGNRIDELPSLRSKCSGLSTVNLPQSKHETAEFLGDSTLRVQLASRADMLRGFGPALGEFSLGRLDKGISSIQAFTECGCFEGLVDDINNDEALARLTEAQSYGTKEKASSSISWRTTGGG
jgi:hypothetical protein